jgi:CheY-like chemotaxis protein
MFVKTLRMNSNSSYRWAMRWIGLSALLVALSINTGRTNDTSNSFSPSAVTAVSSNYPNPTPPLSKAEVRARAEDELRRKNEVKRRAKELDRAKVNEVLQLTEAEHESAAKANEPPPPATTVMERHPQATLLALASVLCIVLTVQTLTRHQREAEIRTLSGNYLADGTEVIRVQMPDLFALPKAEKTEPPADPTSKIEPGKVVARSPRDPVEVFIEEAPARISALRDCIAQLKTMSETKADPALQSPSAGPTGAGTQPPLDEEKKKVLHELHQLVSAFAKSANLWPLRPVWQVTSALELLAERVARKPADATASALRTITAAVDILPSLCTQGIRPDLIILPPIKILAADDDALCRRALGFALSKANLPCDFAENGAQAVKLAQQATYDLILLDIQMPEMDGLAACAEIRNDAKNVTTPIIFVTVQSDFQTRVNSAVSGGTDFMAKPFLVFELTVKAVLAAVSKRLAAPEQGRYPEEAPAQPATAYPARVNELEKLDVGTVAQCRAVSKPRPKPPLAKRRRPDVRQRQKTR